MSICSKKGNGSKLPNGTAIFLFSNIGLPGNHTTLYNAKPEVTCFSNHEFVGDII
jgi:hypothetical protein